MTKTVHYHSPARVPYMRKKGQSTEGAYRGTTALAIYSSPCDEPTRRCMRLMAHAQRNLEFTLASGNLFDQEIRDNRELHAAIDLVRITMDERNFEPCVEPFKKIKTDKPGYPPMSPMDYAKMIGQTHAGLGELFERYLQSQQYHLNTVRRHAELTRNAA